MTVTINDYFLLPPNWSSPFIFKRIWKTAIQSNIKDGEKRSSLFTWPRRSLRFSIRTMTVDESNYLLRKMYKSLHLVFGIPIWDNALALTSTASSGQPTLLVESTEYTNFEVGGKCIIISNDSPDSYEAGEILSIGANSITLTSDLAYSWDSGLFVYPILKARLANLSQNFTNKTDQNVDINFECLEVPDSDVTHAVFTTSVFPTYNGLSVFDINHNWAEPVKTTLGHDTDIMEYLGVVVLSTDVIETNIVIEAKYLFDSSENLNQMLGFFDDQKGRLGSFWMQSFTNDIQIINGFSSTDTTFTINDIKWSSYWSNTTVAGQYVVFNINGTDLYRKIISAPSSTEIELDDNLGVDYSADLQGSFMYIVRFNIDEIEVSKITNSVSEVRAQFRTLYDPDFTYTAP